MTYKYNFSSGPAVLFPEVRRQAIEAIENLDGTGLSILEYPHRAPRILQLMQDVRDYTKKLFKLGDDYEALFLHGGASQLFFQIPMNFLLPTDTASYMDTGVFAGRAIEAAKGLARIHIAGSSKDDDYHHIPKNCKPHAEAKYFHYTSCNTAIGTQFHEIPETGGVPLIADMTSDIFTREMDFSKFSLIYAAIQKNVGIAASGIMVIRHDFLKRQVKTPITSMLDFKSLVEHKSMPNTPNVFALYVALITMQHIEKVGGLAALEKLNKQKADLLYGTLDALPMFRLRVKKEDRSIMNVCFETSDNALEKRLLDRFEQEGVFGIKGFETRGGFRVALYNAIPLSHVQDLCAIIRDFAQKNG